MSYALTGTLVVMWNAVPVPVCELLPRLRYRYRVPVPHGRTTSRRHRAGVTGHVIGVMLVAIGSDARNNTPTSELAMPVAGIVGQVAVLAVPSGTRPNVCAL